MLRKKRRLLSVCHRIDDLEIWFNQAFFKMTVCHRIDDLESDIDAVSSIRLVCHRIDDLKNLISIFKTTYFVVKR